MASRPVFGLDGPVNGECFLAYVKEVLLDALGRRHRPDRQSRLAPKIERRTVFPVALLA
jgi:hypothetical protein